jgi:hypothetical protein
MHDCLHCLISLVGNRYSFSSIRSVEQASFQRKWRSNAAYSSKIIDSILRELIVTLLDKRRRSGMGLKHKGLIQAADRKHAKQIVQRFQLVWITYAQQHPTHYGSTVLSCNYVASRTADGQPYNKRSMSILDDFTDPNGTLDVLVHLVCSTFRLSLLFFTLHHFWCLRFFGGEHPMTWCFHCSIKSTVHSLFAVHCFVYCFLISLFFFVCVLFMLLFCVFGISFLCCTVSTCQMVSINAYICIHTENDWGRVFQRQPELYRYPTTNAISKCVFTTGRPRNTSMCRCKCKSGGPRSNDSLSQHTWNSTIVGRIQSTKRNETTTATATTTTTSIRSSWTRKTRCIGFVSC